MDQYGSFFLMLLAVLIRKRISYEIKTFIIVLLLFLIGCGNLLAWGLMSTFSIFFFSAAIFSTVFSGMRQGIFVLAGSAVFITGSGLAHWKGWLPFAASATGSVQLPSLWIAFVASFIFLAGGCIALVGTMFRAMKSVLTELRDRAQEAEAGQERFEKIFINSPEAMVISDPETAAIIEINDSFSAFTGYTKEETLGKTAIDLNLWYDPNGREQVLEQLMDGGDVQNKKVRFRTSSGDVVSGMLSARQISLDGAPRLLLMSRDITDQVKVEEELLANREKLRSLANRLTVAEEQERRRIARELHDRVIQHMAISKIKIEKFFNTVGCDSTDEPKAEIVNLLDQVIGDARSVLFEISPPIISLLGFGEAVRWLADRFSTTHQIPCEVRLSGVDDTGNGDPIEEEIQIVLFQSIREMLNNIAKYSEADRVDLLVSRKNGNINLRVEDDGVGFDPEETGIRTDTLSGFGLFSIRERVNYFGGEFEIDSAPGQGARLSLTVPVK
jgi:PAS domain S-box-containing protein